MSVIAEIASSIYKTSFDDLEDEIVFRAKERIIDVVGCIVGGADAPGCSNLRALLEEWGGKEESTILVFGKKVPAAHAAFMNAVMARSYDFEPTGPYVEGKSLPGHISGTTVPVAISVAEKCGLSGRELITALVLGDDIASRLLHASKFNIDSGWDSTGIVNAFGAAAIASKLMKLNEEGIVNAFGIVINFLGGTFQNIFDAAHSFKLPQGFSAYAGILSAELAQRGFTGVKDPLLGKHGYFSLYCKTYELGYLTRGLGKHFYADSTCKPYPCCRSNHAAIQAVLELVSIHNIKPDEIHEVIVEVPPIAFDFAVGQPFRIGGGGELQIKAAFSLQYTVASAILRRGVELEHFTDEFIKDEAVAKMIRKIRLSPGMPADLPLAGKVKIKMKDGAEWEREVRIPKGSNVFTPMSSEEKTEKFFKNVRFSKKIPLERAKRAFGMMVELEKIDRVGKIVELLVTR
ncbi:MAG: MmgE/PrpD family protein [candidate division WOR-3 bacterium]